MGAVLVVMQGKKQVAKEPIVKDNFIIGRSKTCDLVLNDSNVSRQHAIISYDNNQYEIKDNNSRNGVILNKSKISGNSLLIDGAEISLGPFSITFYQSLDIVDEQDDEVDDMEEAATSFLSEQAAEDAYHGKKVDVRKPLNKSYKLLIIDGPLKGAKFKDWDGDLTVGRGLDNNVVLLDDAVSTYHARIFEEVGDHFIEDLGSINGTFLQGIKINKQQLTGSRKIRIGSTTLFYTEVNLRKRRRFHLISTIIVAAMVVIAVMIKMLMPSNEAQKYTKSGDSLMQMEKYQAAKKSYEQALSYDGNYEDARNGLRELRRIEEANDLLEDAELKAQHGDFRQALEMCRGVLDIQPQNKQAQELYSVIKVIKEAMISCNARNWRDGVDLLRKAMDLYPKSRVLSVKLAEAEMELAAEEAVTKARNYLNLEEYNLARTALDAITANSVYYKEAQELSTLVNKGGSFANALLNAKKAYRLGNTKMAFMEIERGLSLRPEHPDLLKLQRHVQIVLPLAEKLAQAYTIMDSEKVHEMIELIKTCEEIIATEKDPKNGLRMNAEEVREQIKKRLPIISEKKAAAAYTAWQSGDIRKAYHLYELASAANENNEQAKDQAEKIKKVIVNSCHHHFIDAMQYEAQGQTTEAVQTYRKITQLGFAGETYYERAVGALKRLEFKGGTKIFKDDTSF